jgi:hypothetical protein
MRFVRQRYVGLRRSRRGEARRRREKSSQGVDFFGLRFPRHVREKVRERSQDVTHDHHERPRGNAGGVLTVALPVREARGVAAVVGFAVKGKGQRGEADGQKHAEASLRRGQGLDRVSHGVLDGDHAQPLAPKLTHDGVAMA